MSDRLKRRDIIDRDERDEDNRRIIYMLVEDDSNFLSPFSANMLPSSAERRRIFSTTM